MSGFELLLARLRSWERWVRLHAMVYLGLRGLIAGLWLMLIAASIVLPSRQMPAASYVGWLLLGGGAGLLVASLVAWLRPQERIVMARRYERSFGLQERISTAIELQADPGADPLWRGLQLTDALQAQADIKPPRGLEWRLPKADLGLLVITLLVLTGFGVFARPVFTQAAIRAQDLGVIEEQRDRMEDLVTRIESSPALPEEARDALLIPLQESLQDLEQSASLEQAVSVLREAQEVLEGAGLQGHSDFAGLQQAGSDLANAGDSPLTGFGEALARGDLHAAAEALAALDIEGMDPGALAQLAGQLGQVGQALEGAGPNLAASFQAAAQHVQAGERAAADQALAEASAQLMDTQQQQALAQAVEQLSAALAASEETLLQAAADLPAGDDPNRQEAAGGQGGDQGSAAGSGLFEEEAEPGQEAGYAPIQQSNAPGDGGELPYDSIYAPQRLGGDAGPDGALDPGGTAGDTILGGLESSFQQTGESSIPYQSVFTQYEPAVQEALDSNRIPLALRPLIRDYFSSLAP